MKTTLLILGLLSTVSLCMGSVAKVMHWPGANLALYGGLAVFCFVYAPMWVSNHLKSNPLALSSKLVWLMSVVAGIMFSTGSIFKMLYYPGANMLMLVGMSVFSFLFLPYFFMRNYRGLAV